MGSTEIPRISLARRLASLGRLSDKHWAIIDRLPMVARECRPGEVLADPNDKALYCHVILEGFAARCRLRGEDPGPQIVSVAVPGDVLHLHALHTSTYDDLIVALGRARVGLIRLRDLRDMLDQHPQLGEVLWRVLVAELAIMKQRIFVIGQSSAAQRTAHYLCEFRARLVAVGYRDDVIDLPLTQAQLASLLGMSGIHMSRVIRELRDRKLISLKGRTIEADWDNLEAFAGFDGAYLGFRVLETAS